MVQEIGVEDLHEVVTLPYVAHQLDPARVERVWVHGRAVVVDAARSRPSETKLGPLYTCLGPVQDLDVLMAHVAGTAPRPWRVTVERPAEVPAAWPLLLGHDWLWMTSVLPPPADGRWQVDELDGVRDAVEIDDLLDAAHADSYARPGLPGISAWLGIRERSPHASTLLAAGALQRMHDGTLHVRGVGVRPETRGAGAGTALSAALTRHALAHGSSVATLAVYTHNRVARRMYDGLGYRTAHAFRSGEVAP